MFRVLRPHTAITPHSFADRSRLSTRAQGATPRPALHARWVCVETAGSAPRLELRWLAQDDQDDAQRWAA